MTSVELANIALGKIGAARIASLSDSSDEAVFTNEVYAPCLEQALKFAPWTFATTWAKLTKSAVQPTVDYPDMTQFDLEASTLLIRRVSNGRDDYSLRWFRQGTTAILVDEDTNCYVLATKTVDISACSRDFALAVSDLVAAHIAVSITHDPVRERSLREAYEINIRRAAALDGKQGTAERMAPSYQRPSDIGLRRY